MKFGNSVPDTPAPFGIVRAIAMDENQRAVTVAGGPARQSELCAAMPKRAKR